jgi:hypothetical protein
MEPATMAPTDLIPLSVAAAQIGTPERPLDPDSLRRRAGQLGLLGKLPDGRLGISSSLMKEMRRHYRASGWLLPRGGKRFDENRKAAAATA